MKKGKGRVTKNMGKYKDTLPCNVHLTWRKNSRQRKTEFRIRITFYADPNPAFHFYADPDQTFTLMQIRILLLKTVVRI
jgi:hypothetical protein